MPRPVVIGVDMGTTNIKAVAYDAGGVAHTEASTEVSISTPTPRSATQDPDEIMAALVASVSKVSSELRAGGLEVGGLSFSSAMHSLIAIGPRGSRLTPCITWADNRAIDQVEKLRATSDAAEIYARTGTPIHPMSPLAKLLWFRDEQPDLFARAARWISIKEYALALLSGEYAVDRSVASATGLFNIFELDWDEGALEVAGIRRDQLSPALETTHALSLIEPYATQLGLPAGTPLVLGASDGALGNLGMGVLDPGVVACSIGTSGAVRTTVDEPRTDASGRLFCYVLTEGLYIVGGSTNSGGLVLKWVRDRLFPDMRDDALAAGRDPYDVLDDLAGTVPAGAEGLLFLPYLAGERAPFWRNNLTGGFYGLTIQHGREHMVRAVFEGVIFHLFTVVQALEQTVGRPHEFRASGGFSYSDLWPQIMADVFRSEICIPARQEAACWGAALLGLKGVGAIDDLGIARAPIEIERTYRPDEATEETYGAAVAAFHNLFAQLEFTT